MPGPSHRDKDWDSRRAVCNHADHGAIARSPENAVMNEPPDGNATSERAPWGIHLAPLLAQTREVASARRLLRHIRPPLPVGAQAAYACVELLLLGHLLEGSVDRADDLDRFRQELADPAYRRCAVEHISLYSFSRVVHLVSHAAPVALARNLLWPAFRPQVLADTLRAHLFLEVTKMIASPEGTPTRPKAWVPVPSRSLAARGRGRPVKDPERDGIYRELLRHEAFEGRRPDRRAFHVAIKLLLKPPSFETFRQELGLRRSGQTKSQNRETDPFAQAPIPEDFHLTGFARRLAVLKNPFVSALYEAIPGDRRAFADVAKIRTKGRRGALLDEHGRSGRGSR